MERRRHARQASSIKATIRDLGGSQHSCLIRDFSQSGMLVTFDPPLAHRALSTLHIPGSAAGWPSISIQSPDGAALVLEGEVMHLNPQLCGIKFIHENLQHFAALKQLSRQHEHMQPKPMSALPTRPGGLSHPAKGNLIRATNRELRQFLEAQLEPCFDLVEQRLLNTADRSLSAEQNMLLDAMGLLRRQQAQLIRQLIEQLCSDALDLSRGTQQAPVSEVAGTVQKQLMLVEKDDFDNWLVVRVAISKAELAVRDHLIELQLRLEAVFGSPAGERRYNPYSPAAIANTLYSILEPLELKHQVITILFETLQEHTLSHLELLYQALNQVFIDAQVLPNIDAASYLVAQARPQRDSTPAPSSATEPAPAAAESVVPAPASAPTPIVESVARGSLPPSRRDALGTATRLQSLQRQASPVPGTTTYQPGSDTLKALSRLQKDILTQAADASSAPLRQQLLNASDSQTELGEHEQDSADIVENLFDCITQNPRVQDDLQADLRKLQVPMLGLLLKDPELFTSDFHPARQAINYLALLADRESHSVEHNKPIIRAAIHAILASDDDHSGFDRALHSLEPLVERENRLIKRNIAHLCERHAGQQRLRHAHAAVEQALAQLLPEPIRQPIIALLEHGWKDLLRLSYLREGQNSQPWTLALDVIQRLVQYTLPGQPQSPASPQQQESLLRLIDKGLSRVPDQDNQQPAVRARLAHLLNNPDDTTEPLVSFQPEPSDSALLQTQIDALAESDHALQRWIKRAGNLRSEQWFELSHGDLQAQLSQLVWISDDGYRLVFANHQATRDCELTLDQVAMLLRDEQLIALGNAALPAVEQGLDALVQKLYDQLAFDSSHDQLTGLYTRKEFCRQLAQVAAQAREQGTSHTLMFIDILQFKVINNTCGYDAGDRLLRDIALHIKGLLSDDAFAGRMGPDQFALMLPIHADTLGFRQANQLKQAIEGQRFVHDKQSFVINIALSLAGIDQQTQRIMELLRRVEAATGLSKKSGHKDIQTVRPGDERLEELDELMSWVTRINRALDTNNLNLRCQRIIPTPSNASEHQYFETLLTVVDEHGEHIPPTEFIKVAEEYSRMGAVDRWVISTVLAWMHDNKPLLKHFGGFSINLSGHSMNDDTFPDFLFEALVQYQIPRDKLVFEITETTAVANLEDAADFIDEMRNIGCRFSLDDFGVGQSSYAYLKRLPVDFIKIDGAFVRDINNNDVDYALVRSITEMGHYLGKQVIAEYVSSEAIHASVSDIGVDYVQGHLFGQPVMLDQLAKVLQPIDQLSE